MIESKEITVTQLANSIESCLEKIEKSRVAYRMVNKNHVSKEDIEIFIKTYDHFVSYIDDLRSSKGYNNSYWTLIEFVRDSGFNLYSDIYKKCYDKKSMSKDLESDLYTRGIFFSIDQHMSIAKSEKHSDSARVSAISKVCNEDDLVCLTKSKNKKVRHAAYMRLNIPKYIESISKDRCNMVRRIGIDYLPYGNPNLSLFINEKAAQNLLILVSKMSKKDLLFLLNSRSRSSWANKRIEKIIQDRLSN